MPVLNNNKSITNPIFDNSSSFHANTVGNSLNIGEGIRLSHKVSMNLKNTIDTLDLIPEIDEKLGAEPDVNQKNSFMNIFKRKKFDNTKSADLEEINRFNLSIINNNRWGLDSLSKARDEPKRRTVIKPSQKELEKEVGNYLINLNLLENKF